MNALSAELLKAPGTTSKGSAKLAHTLDRAMDRANFCTLGDVQEFVILDLREASPEEQRRLLYRHGFDTLAEVRDLVNMIAHAHHQLRRVHAQAVAMGCPPPTVPPFPAASYVLANAFPAELSALAAA